ncbi:DUF707 domain-containing protein [Paenibacillus cremeus]|nr:DUF707 domain-containing protein [Paenibacillus cremeus]
MGNHRYLVIARVGDGSLHREWLQPAEHKNFDLCLSYYGNEPGRYANECDYYVESKGPKFIKLHELIQSLGSLVFQYDAIWLPDDDISTNAYNISRMFQIFSEQNLQLAQPALTKHAFFQVTVRHIDYKLRYTKFVEVMVPIFSREALQICWPTFNKSLTGWGLEHVWAKLLGYPNKKMAIIDETPVKHTRPAGGGELYRNIEAEYGINVWQNTENLLNEYGIVAPPPHEITFYGGIKLWNPIGAKRAPAKKVRGRRSKRRGRPLRRKGSAGRKRRLYRPGRAISRRSGLKFGGRGKAAARSKRMNTKFKAA